MKITPSKDYKKPIYAIGLTTAVMALAVTGCTNPFKKPVDLAGDVQIIDPTTTTEEVVIDGEVALDGDVSIDDGSYNKDGTVATDKDNDPDDGCGPELSGMVSVVEPDETK